MAKIFDLHNDFLTNNSVKNKKKYIDSINRNKDIKMICAVVWTSKMRDPLVAIEKFYNKYIKENDKLALCIEDLSFINKIF